MSHLPDIPSWIISLLAGIVGVASSWGYLKASMDQMKKTIDDNVRDIKRLNDRGLQLVFVPDCDKIRRECHEIQGQRFEEMKEAVMENRKISVIKFEEMGEKFDEFTRFMGYVTRALEDRNGKKP